MDESKGNLNKSLDSDKKNVSALHSTQSGNGPLQSSNNRSDYTNEVYTLPPINSMMASNAYYAPPQPLPSPFDLQEPRLPPLLLPENTVDIPSKPLSSPNIPEIASIQVTLALNTLQPQQQKNRFSLKSSVTKPPTNDNFNNEPTPLEKHDKIRFELKSKNKFVGKLSVNPNKSTQNIFEENNKMKSLSLSAILNPLTIEDESQQSQQGIRFIFTAFQNLFYRFSNFKVIIFKITIYFFLVLFFLKKKISRRMIKS
jgi:hypothetical protein